MDGENNGSKPYEQMDDLGVPSFLETPIYVYDSYVLGSRVPCFFHIKGDKLINPIVGVYIYPL